MQDMCQGSQSLNKLEAGCVELDDGSKFELVRNSAILVICYVQEGEQRKLLGLECGQLGKV